MKRQLFASNDSGSVVSTRFFAKSTLHSIQRKASFSCGLSGKAAQRSQAAGQPCPRATLTIPASDNTASTIVPAPINLSGARAYDGSAAVTAEVFGTSITGLAGQRLTLSGSGQVGSASGIASTARTCGRSGT